MILGCVHPQRGEASRPGEVKLARVMSSDVDATPPTSVESPEMKSFRTLGEQTTYDVIIIGGGRCIHSALSCLPSFATHALASAVPL
jgi:hypothetical protein